MAPIGIYIPSYKRPQAILRVVDNIKKTTIAPYELYFGLEADDHESLLLCKDNGIQFYINESTPSFSNALQSIYDHTPEEVFFPANDDFRFLDKWDEAPLAKLKDHPNIMVLGVPDSNPNTRYSTVQFIRRQYIEDQSGVIDMPRRVFYPYKHNYIDDEMTETAQFRNVWAFSPSPCIEHMHPSFTWLDEFPTDATYAKNEATFPEDTAVYHSRKHLWGR